MTDRDECDTMHVLLAELATSAATGHDRARALEHLAGCPACRDEMTELARAADTLLLLAPRVEPPPGFEARVIAAMQANSPTAHPVRRLVALSRLGRSRSTRPRGPQERPADPHRPRLRLSTRIAATVITMLVSLAGGAALAQSRGAQDRALAEHYRQTLQVADGRYLKAARLMTADGAQAGTVFLYQGNPSWIFVTVTAAPIDGNYKMLLRHRDGSLYSAGICRITDRNGTFGYRLSLPVSSISQIQLQAPTPSDLQLTATT